MLCNLFKRCLVLLATVFTGSCFGQVMKDTMTIDQMLGILDSIYTRINVNYVEVVPMEKMMRKGIDGMFESLDPFTKYLSKEEAADLRINLSLKFGGTGMVLAPLKDGTMVTRVFEGYPASRSGIAPGDLVFEVDGTPTAGKALDVVRQKLMGEPGKPVQVKIKHFRTSDTASFTLVREEIKLKPVPYYGVVGPGIGYIQLTAETENCSENVRQALLDLQKTAKIRSLVLDLRDNAGGLVSEAIKIANFFLGKGNVIVRIKGRNEDSVVYARENPIDKSMPLVILTNRSTISAGEILSGAIQDNDRGVIVGQKTFGKGLVGQVYNMGNGAEAVITTAFYYTPSGRCIQARNYWSTPGTGIELADSLKRVFKTTNGRFVREAEGIIPDLQVPGKTGSNLMDFLLDNLSVFEYAIEYKHEHPSISNPKDFYLTGAEYEAFVNSVKEKISGYPTQTDEKLEALKNVALKEGYFNAIEPFFIKMETAINDEKMNTLKKYRNEVKDLVEQEITYLYYGENGRKEAGFRNDIELKKAIEILTDGDLYHSLLNPHKM